MNLRKLAGLNVCNVRRPWVYVGEVSFRALVAWLPFLLIAWLSLLLIAWPPRRQEARVIYNY
jgi:hypothetical protein